MLLFNPDRQFFVTDGLDKCLLIRECTLHHVGHYYGLDNRGLVFVFIIIDIVNVAL